MEDKNKKLEQIVNTLLSVLFDPALQFLLTEKEMQIVNTAKLEFEKAV